MPSNSKLLFVACSVLGAASAAHVTAASHETHHKHQVHGVAVQKSHHSHHHATGDSDNAAMLRHVVNPEKGKGGVVAELEVRADGEIRDVITRREDAGAHHHLTSSEVHLTKSSQREKKTDNLHKNAVSRRNSTPHAELEKKSAKAAATHNETDEKLHREPVKDSERHGSKRRHAAGESAHSKPHTQAFFHSMLHSGRHHQEHHDAFNKQSHHSYADIFSAASSHHAPKHHTNSHNTHLPAGHHEKKSDLSVAASSSHQHEEINEDKPQVATARGHRHRRVAATAKHDQVTQHPESLTTTTQQQQHPPHLPHRTADNVDFYHMHELHNGRRTLPVAQHDHHEKPAGSHANNQNKVRKEQPTTPEAGGLAEAGQHGILGDSVSGVGAGVSDARKTGKESSAAASNDLSKKRSTPDKPTHSKRKSAAANDQSLFGQDKTMYVGAVAGFGAFLCFVCVCCCYMSRASD